MRKILIAIAAGLIAAVANAWQGINLPGLDYDHFAAPSPLTCRASCGGDTRCHAYTWVRPGIQGPDAQCWLKNGVPHAVRNSCCESGSRESITKHDLLPESGVDRPGSDYARREVQTWEGCVALCEQDGRCASWTFVRAGVQGPRPVCWVKDRVARPVTNANTVSGVKFKYEAVPIDGGTALVPATQ